ncbi:hypothetical protein PPACK8108_LOCUS7531 [Phakopsora pachyrhizi]|uniref:U1-type domain-containing protein n=1 Tax=Phakopsora pachyrhizi TaxID=170000 RepID=A0AAV0AUG1_PHAPC|nr:hypothetical protein PPACK8108_LOCUS7531 [Phakopsora pachyrhizi]
MTAVGSEYRAEDNHECKRQENKAKKNGGQKIMPKGFQIEGFDQRGVDELKFEEFDQGCISVGQKLKAGSWKIEDVDSGERGEKQWKHEAQDEWEPGQITSGGTIGEKFWKCLLCKSRPTTNIIKHSNTENHKNAVREVEKENNMKVNPHHIIGQE